MDIFFQDPTEIPLPPEEVRIRELRATPMSDGRRVKVYLEVDPFQKRPNADLRITNPEAEAVAIASIIESMTRKMEVTLHLRGNRPAGEYHLQAILYYTQTEEDEQPAGGAEDLPAPPEPEMQEVDRSETSFELPVEA